MKSFLYELLKSMKFILVMIVIVGFIYPLVITIGGNVFFPKNATGSIIEKNGVKVGSELVGQNFTSPHYFWGRPSDAGEYPYNTLESAGSNKSPAGEEFKDILKTRIENLKKYDEDNESKIPVDLVTASGSGLDPHISIAGAKYQAARVAKYRGISKDKIDKLIDEHSEKLFLGTFGTAKINVLKLNLALDDIAK